MKRYSIDNYDKYVDTQINRGRSKWGSLTFNPRMHRSILHDVHEYTKDAQTICCMGIRNGNEYKEFKEHEAYKNAEIYGVDIVPEVTKVGDNCYAYDFNILPDEWENKFDLVYSNSLDHAFDVNITLVEWRRVTKDGGYILIVASNIDKVTESDIYTFIPDDFIGAEKVWTIAGQVNTFNVLYKVSKL